MAAATFSGLASAGLLPYIQRTGTGPTDHMSTIAEITDNFELLDEWDDRYRYVIELGRGLAPFPESERTDENKVRGCVSQVWLATRWPAGPGGAPVLEMQGDSDAHIVRGLVAILMTLFAGRTAEEVIGTDARAVFGELGLSDHLTSQRSNGLNSMVQRIRADAEAALVE